MTDPEPARRLLRNARREALLTMVIWVLALTWTVGYCYLYGYQHAADSWPVRWGLASVRAVDDFQQVAGLPDWVFYGILLPWLACTLLTLAIGLFGMTDDELGSEAGESPAPGSPGPPGEEPPAPMPDAETGIQEKRPADEP